MGSQRLQIVGIGKRQWCTLNRQKVRGVIRVARLLLRADRGNQRLILLQEGTHAQRRQTQNNGAPVQRSLQVKTFIGRQLALFNQQVCALVYPVHEDPAGELNALACRRIPDQGGGLLSAEFLEETVQGRGRGRAGGGESNHGFHSTVPCSTARGKGGQGECARR